MKKFFITRFLFLSLVTTWGVQSAASSSVDLFQVDSNAFPLPIVYKANINSNCTFASKPISVSWIGDTSRLSLKVWIGMGSVMGVSVLSQCQIKNATTVVFQIKTMAKNKVSWP